MSTRVFTASQPLRAVDWLFSNEKTATFTLTLSGKRHWAEFTECNIYTALEKSRFIDYLRAAINLNVSRYGHREEDIGIAIHTVSTNVNVFNFLGAF